MPQYPETPLDRATQRAADEINEQYLTALENAGPGACPNCLKTGGGWCWCCTDDKRPPRDVEAWKQANPGAPVPGEENTP